MSKRFATLFAALALALGLLAPNAFAQLSFSASQATGAPGTTVDLTLGISGTPEGVDEVDLSHISAYSFNLFWNPQVLSFSSVVNAPGSTSPQTSQTDGSASILWVDNTYENPIPFSSLIVRFNIRGTALPGSFSFITFGDFDSAVGYVTDPSNLSDDGGGYYEFPVLVGNNPQMKVTVAVTPVPEPAEVSMLLAGLGLMAAVIRRRKNRQA